MSKDMLVGDYVDWQDNELHKLESASFIHTDWRVLYSF